MRKKVYIIYSSRKGGHKFPAEALCSYLKEHYSSKLSVKIINFLDHSRFASLLDTLGRVGDLKARKVWKASYCKLETSGSRFTKLYKNLIRFIFTNPLVRFSIGKPDLIVSFQPEMNCLLGNLEKGCPLHTLIVDYSAHGLWVDEKVQRYYVASSEVANKVSTLGVSINSIEVTGIPLRPNFAKVMNRSISEQREKLCIDKGKATILIVGGLLGTMVDFWTIMNSMKAISTSYQLLVVFGKNKLSRNRCKKIGLSSAYLYDVVLNMDEFIWASDLVISKPGSVTIGETIALGKPMILVEPRAGSQQEIIFSDYICSNGAGISVKDSNKVGAIVNELLANREKLNSMARCAEGLGSINRSANENIARSILSVVFPDTGQ